jgi:release factor glutamine methyltransferase
MAQHRDAPRRNWTVKGLLEWTTQYFTERGLGAPRLDAEVLLAHVLGKDRLYLYLNLERPVTPSERADYRAAVLRRARREPIALITGEKEFWSFSFAVAPGVLIPRPDTEALVERVIEKMAGLARPRFLEIGVGSGAISISLLRENQHSVGVGTDISTAALRLARQNAMRAGVSSRFDLVACDLFSALRPGRYFHIVCSNPPYIPTRDISALEPEIASFEPIAALDGGKDGLSVIRRIARAASEFLAPGGFIALEVGDHQAQDVAGILEQYTGCRETMVYKDLAGKDRVVMGSV